MKLSKTRLKVDKWSEVVQFESKSWFLADRTNGRAIATLLRLSVCRRLSVSDVMYCG